MSGESNLLVLNKGLSWCGINLDVLPEIDFDLVEKETNSRLNENGKPNLSLKDEDIRLYIKQALAQYVCQLRYFHPPFSADEQRRALKKVEKACELLESFLEWDTPGVLGEDEFDPMKLFLYQTVVPNVKCLKLDAGKSRPRLAVKKYEDIFNFSERGDIIFHGKNVAEYLAQCRNKIRQAHISSKPGPREDFAIRRCLIDLREFFHSAGGDGREAGRPDGGKFSGAFLTFAKLLLDHTKEPLGLTGNPFAESTLGAIVVNKYRL